MFSFGDNIGESAEICFKNLSIADGTARLPVLIIHMKQRGTNSHPPPPEPVVYLFFITLDVIQQITKNRQAAKQSNDACDSLRLLLMMAEPFFILAARLTSEARKASSP